jgi:hypothetical protein
VARRAHDVGLRTRFQSREPVSRIPARRPQDPTVPGRCREQPRSRPGNAERHPSPWTPQPSPARFILVVQSVTYRPGARSHGRARDATVGGCPIGDRSSARRRSGIGAPIVSAEPFTKPRSMACGLPAFDQGSEGNSTAACPAAPT